MNTSHELVRLISDLIAFDLRIAQHEVWFPHNDTELRDATIEFHNGRAEKLRIIRKQLEDLMAAPFQGINSR